MADLEARFRTLKVTPAPDLWHEIELAALQREPAPRSFSIAMLLASVVVLAAAVLVLFIAGPLVLQPSGTFEGTPPSSGAAQPERPASIGPEPSACVEPPASLEPAPPPVEPSPSIVPDLDLPGTRPARAGEYGWSGVLDQSTGMHRLIDNQCSPGTWRETQLVFAVRSDCFPSSLTSTGGEPEAVTVAGLEGLYLEGHTTDEMLLFTSSRGDETTGAYALPIGELTLCVYLTWDPATTQEELDATRQVVDSIRGQQYGPDRIRITFTLPAGFDVG